MKMQSSKRPPLPLPKPVRWVASSKEDLSAFPNGVKTRVGGALWDARIGLKSPVVSATPECSRWWWISTGTRFGRSTPLRFSKAVYVLHAFQKKSRRAIATPKDELDLIELGSL